MVNRLIQGLIMIVIGLALLPVVNDFAVNLTEDGAEFHDTTVGTLIDLIPLLYVVIIVVGVVSYVVYHTRQM